MKIDAVSVTSSNIAKSAEFYRLLGFEFADVAPDEDHVEPKPQKGSARLMIDSEKLMAQMGNTNPQPANHSSFAIQYDLPEEVNAVCQKITAAGFSVEKEPWDAFWGQRYAVVVDPAGYKVDLYAYLE